jgi:hypothetical protein
MYVCMYFQFRTVEESDLDRQFWFNEYVAISGFAKQKAALTRYKRL